MATRYDNPTSGCYQDGAVRSQDEMDRYAISLAKAYGWDGGEGDDADEEFLSETAEEAINYLGGLEMREGYWWGFDNGDFGLWTGEGQ